MQEGTSGVSSKIFEHHAIARMNSIKCIKYITEIIINQIYIKGGTVFGLAKVVYSGITIALATSTGDHSY
jgi:hypothetical protein